MAFCTSFEFSDVRLIFSATNYEAAAADCTGIDLELVLIIIDRSCMYWVGDDAALCHRFRDGRERFVARSNQEMAAQPGSNQARYVHGNVIAPNLKTHSSSSKPIWQQCTVGKPCPKNSLAYNYFVSFKNHQNIFTAKISSIFGYLLDRLRDPQTRIYNACSADVNFLENTATFFV